MKSATWKEAQKNAQAFEETWETIVEMMEDLTLKKIPSEIGDLLSSINEEFSSVLDTLREFIDELENSSAEGETIDEDDE